MGNEFAGTAYAVHGPDQMMQSYAVHGAKCVLVRRKGDTYQRTALMR